MKIDKDKNKEEFSSLLRSTGRDGVDYVLEDLEKGGFFEAPASAGHHLNVAGGLCQHSINTCRAALMVWEGMQKLDPSVKAVKRESVIIASLLHDVCKTDIYKPTVKKRRTPIGTMLLLSGLEMTDEEMLAIRWHMGAFGLNQDSYEDIRNYDTARALYPLCAIVQSGDSLAASIMEMDAAETDEM